jgi:cyclopropane fatty-acyl-phospholipid synthase-like methyltransferase
MLKNDQDAYGQALFAYYQGKDVLEIVERDDGYINAFPGPANYFSEFESWSGQQQKAMDFARGRVLDIGCGAGRASLYLQEKGLQVTGIDNSPLALEVCRLRGLKHTSPTPITKISKVKLGVFDTIIMLGNNFGLFGNPRRAKWLLKRIYNMTTPQGRIITESNDIYKTDNLDHLAYHQRNQQRGRMAGQIRMRVRFEKYITPWFDYLMVSKHEMKAILEGTGWTIRQFIDPKTDDKNQSTYIAVIEKR